MATTYHNAIQKLYVAYFNRPADYAGLNFWETVVEGTNGDTTIVSAAFAASAEYKAEYANMTNTQIVARVYQNLFGHAPDAAGSDFWVNAMANGAVTIDQAVTQIAAGAQGTDKVAYDNKVLAATAFTAALDQPAEQTAYSGAAANAVAKTFIASITTDASLTTAIAPTALTATVKAVVKAGTPFTLTGALASLDAAQDAKAAFLKAADGTDNTTSATEADIATAKTTAVNAIDALVANASATDTLVAGSYTAASAGVRVAMVADLTAANAAALTAAQKTLTTAQVKISEVAGLTQAVANMTAATAASVAADKAVVSAAATLAAAEASYEVTNATTITVDGATGAVAGLIEVKDGKLVLVTGVTEAKNPGVTALLNATIAVEAAEKAAINADAIETESKRIVDRLDIDPAALEELADVAAGMTIVKLPAGVMPSDAQITTEVSSLTAVYNTAQAKADASGVQADIDAAAAAKLKLDTFVDLVDLFIAADATNPLVAAQTAAAAQVKAASDAITALTKATAALATADASVAQLAALNAEIVAAGELFVENNFNVPSTLAGFTAASANSDVFLAGAVDSSVAGFGLLGQDVLFIGTDYTLNTGKFATDGNNSVLEVFIAQVGNDTTITLETKPFSSNSADAEVVITLTGVAAADVHLANGIITVG